MEAIYARQEGSFEFGGALLWPVAHVIRDLMKEKRRWCQIASLGCKRGNSTARYEARYPSVSRQLCFSSLFYHMVKDVDGLFSHSSELPDKLNRGSGASKMSSEPMMTAIGRVIIIHAFGIRSLIKNSSTKYSRLMSFSVNIIINVEIYFF
jgi:hypothetical protein